MDPMIIAVLCVVLVFFLILFGAQIGVALAAVSVIGIWAITGKFIIAINLLQTTCYSAVMDYVFAVVPLFILMGLFSTMSGATEELFVSAQLLLGRIRGGLGIATVLANAVFAAITGVSIASAAVFTKIALPQMKRHHYDPKFSLGIVATSAILGMLIPPSMLMIVYGVLTEQSIGRLFVSGIIPGLIVTLVLSIGIYIRVRINPAIGGKITEKKRMGLNELIRIAATPWAVLLLISTVLGGIWGGIFTPTEAGAVGAAGAFLLVIFKRKYSNRLLWQVLLDTGKTTASIFLLLICAQMFSRMLTISGLTQKISLWASQLPVPPIFVIFGFIIVFIVLGCIIDSTSILLLTIPIMHPVIVKLGFDPIWFAIVAIFSIEIGLITPPFGMVIFSMKSAVEEEIEIAEIFAGSFPFLILLFISLIIIVAFPPITIWLPSLM